MIGVIDCFLLVLFLFYSSISTAETDYTHKKFTTKEGEVGPKQVFDILEDQRGIIYVADTIGVLEYDGVQWRRIVLPNEAQANALAADKNGRVYVSGPGELGYLSPDKSGQMEFKSIREKLTESQIRDLSGYIKIESLGLGMAFVTEHKILLWNNNAIHEIASTASIRTSFSWQDRLFIVDSQSGILELADQKLISLEGGKFFSATAIYASKSDELIGGSMSDGLLQLKLGASSIHFGALPNQDRTQLLGTMITHIVASQDTIFVGTIGKGLLAFSSKTGRPISFDEKIRKDIGMDVHALAVDKHNRIWVGTAQGIAVVSGGPLELEKGQVKNSESEFFAYIRSCISMKDNAVVFGGAFFQELGGVQTLEASKLNRPELSFDQNALRFSYASSDLVNANLTEYQTKLLGYDSEWTDWSQRTYREFTNLVWKNYIFQVRAKRSDGSVSQLASFELVIMPPWYERYWFYLLQLGILTILLFVITYLRGWTKRASTSDKLNGVIVGTIWGYSFSKVGVSGVIWAMSGGAAFLAIIANAFMGIFLKPLQKKLESKIIRMEDSMIMRAKRDEIAKDKHIQALVDKLKSKKRPRPVIKMRMNKLQTTGLESNVRPFKTNLTKARTKAESAQVNLPKSA